ncbi:MAG: AbrB/MazE/SpoVT family DNA-binding domain-containing protein [Candidatus Thermoplasmatota archaeon]|nr:AbrB/MazE/SpoVT family DNA-binding domain-containing protein [Candidatus Thermoplasmatota archaeon]
MRLNNVGIIVGMTQEAVIDDKGRIVISKEIREALGLKKGMVVKLHAESNRIILEKAVSPEEFILNMKGFIKKDSKVPVSDPLDLKKIWK